MLKRIIMFLMNYYESNVKFEFLKNEIYFNQKIGTNFFITMSF